MKRERSPSPPTLPEEECRLQMLPEEIRVMISSYCDEYAFVLRNGDILPVKDAAVFHSGRALPALASKMGNVKLFAWLMEEGVVTMRNRPHIEHCCNLAAQHGHTTFIGYLGDQWKAMLKPYRYPPWTNSTMFEAAFNGHLDTVAYLRTQNCPWNSYVVHAAIMKDNLPMLKYAIENDCPHDVVDIHVLASSLKRTEILAYIERIYFRHSVHVAGLGVLATHVADGLAVAQPLCQEPEHGGQHQ